MPDTASRYRIVVSLLALAALALGLWIGQRAIQPKGHVTDGLAATVLPQPRPLAPFELIDQQRQPFGLERLKGRWSFLAFGYTHCPDVCPMTLGALKQASEQIRAALQSKKQPQVVFVSVDPERDTPQQLDGYVSYFSKDFVGVTGSPQAIEAFARQLSVPYGRSPGKASDEYSVDHSASILLIDPQARLFAIFSAPHDPHRIASEFLEIRRIEG
jgi:protein SCO1/2